MIRIIVVDDHPVVRLGIRRLLEPIEDMQVIGEASTGEAAIHLARSTYPDIILMDLSMPGSGGLSATHKLLHTYPTLKIIIVTFRDEDPFPERSVQAGAVGYISKKSSDEELVTAIRQVIKGQIYITPKIAQRMAVQQASNSAHLSPFTKLSDRELEVMDMVTQGKKISDIAKKLYLSPKTINTYRYRLFSKLNISNDVELTLLAMRYGLLRGAKQLADFQTDPVYELETSS